MKNTLSKSKCIILILLLAVTLIPNTIYADDTEEDMTPYVQYNFNSNLTDSRGHSNLTAWTSTPSDNRNNSFTAFGSDDNGNYWQWKSTAARGGGFYIDIDKNIGEEYTIGLKFSFENTYDGWRKIIDYKNSTVDTGFYFYNNGHLNFYNYGVNGASVTQANQVVDLIVRRNKDKTFEAYVVNGTTKKLDMSVIDSQDQGVPAVINGKTRLGFFFDDIATGSEASPGGKVYNLKIWDRYVDPDKVIEALLPKGNVISRYIDEDGDKVTDDTKVSGTTGKPYSVKEQEVYGYEYLRSEGANTTGTFPDGETIYVKFIYKCLIPYTVTARYVDEDGNKLCEDIIYKGEDGKPYQVHKLEIEGYDFVRVEGDETGTYVKKPQLVTYIYKKAEEKPSLEEGTVRAVYVDEAGNNINDDIIYKGYIDEQYKTSKLVINGYEFKQVIGAESGKYAKTPAEVKYVYAQKESSDEDIGGSVIIRYQDNKGYTISSDVICNGKIGDNYTAEKKDISKFKFDKIIGEEKGKIEKGVKVVTVVYIPLASDVIARYVDDNGITIANTNIYSGGIGQNYKTDKLEIDGYRLIKIDGNETGVFSEDVHVVKYVYKRLGNITVEFVDLLGNKIKDNKLYTDLVGEEYTLTHPDIRGYEFVRAEGNESGQYKIENQILKYVYEKIIEGTVTVHFVDQDNNKIIADKEIYGRVGKPYEVDVPNIHGYEYLRTEGKAKGELVEGNIDVTVFYKLIMPNTVTAKYIDEDGNELCSDIVYKGYTGNNYRTSKLEMSGYEFVELMGSESGKFKKEPQLVTYVYKKQVPENGMVTAMYVDEDGNILHSELSYRGLLGDSYKTSELVMPGYELKEIIGDETSSYKKEDQTVKYVYVEKETEEQLGGTVIVKYQTEDGLTIRYDEIFNGDIGQDYKAIRYQIPGYTFKRAEGPIYDLKTRSLFRMARAAENGEEGQIEEVVKVVIMYYEPEPKKDGKATSAIAKYVDSDGNTLHFDNIYNGIIGDTYNTVKENIEGYGLFKIEGNESGIFDEDVQIVTYIYKKVGKVIVEFVDEDGNVIKKEEHTGFIGDNIKLDNGIEVIFTDKEQKLVYAYEKTAEADKNQTVKIEENKVVKTGDINEPYLNFYIGLLLISIIGAANMLRKMIKIK